jgi:nitroimidazol reductase NimA-like FMN-containing flavoprotein (pyridoxamine 5'-phosphate oxidase superfamily)
MAKLDLSLAGDELDRFLTDQRTIRLATASLDGRPQVVPLWFVWIEGVVFMNSTMGNVSIRNIQANPRATGTVDDGDPYEELRGVVIEGPVEWANDDPRLETVKETWSNKYMNGNPVPYDRWKGRTWFRLLPERVTSWDFCKIPEAKARAKAEAEAKTGATDG